MPGKSYSEIYLHITWHTKSSDPILKGSIKNEVYKYLKTRCVETPGVICHAVGGMPDHVHLCVSVPPSLLISKWIGELKGGSSYQVNSVTSPKPLQWQAGYGVVSFGKNHLDFVRDYIENQERRHGAGSTHERLEMAGIEDG